MRILVINGPNINMLGIREKDIYGSGSYADLLEYIKKCCDIKNIYVKCFQSNHEGAIIDEIQSAYGVFDGIIINPAAYTHTSVAIADALKAVALPSVEVHISDINTREPFRRLSYTASACICTVAGQGFAGYGQAIDLLEKKLLDLKSM